MFVRSRGAILPLTYLFSDAHRNGQLTGSPGPIFTNFSLKTTFLDVSCQSEPFPCLTQFLKKVPKGRVAPHDLGNHFHASDCYFIDHFRKWNKTF